MGSDSPKSHFLLRFFRWFCNPEYVEDIEGDLLERFDKKTQKKGLNKARWYLMTDILRLFRPAIIRPLQSTQKLNSIDILKHNILLTFRNFKKHKSNFFINMIGLSTGLASVLFIYLWINDEISIDEFHEQGEQLYQIRTNHRNADGIRTGIGVPGLLLDEIKNDLPEIKSAVAVTDVHEYTLSTDDNSFRVNGRFASEDFFKIFSYPILEGNSKTLLNDKSGIIITESLAKRIFNTTNAIGKTIDWHFWNTKKTVVVNAVISDVPANSSEQFDFLMSWDYYHDDLINYKAWGNYYGRIIIAVNESADLIATNAKIDAIVAEKQGSDNVDTILASYQDQYLYNKYGTGKQAGGRIEYIWLFSAVALFILLIACINFINLSTAKASHKTKEIGVKKTMGASRFSIMSQYFTESIILGILSLIVSIGIVWLFIPQFNMIAGKQIEFQIDGVFASVSMLIIFIVGVVAGMYPALYLSGLNILEVLKSGTVKSSGQAFGRKALVVIQFSISIILIVSTWLIQAQMEYIQKKNLGYDRQNVIYIEREGNILEKSDAFLAELKKIPAVETAAASGFMIGGANSTGGIRWEGRTDDDRLNFWETRFGIDAIETLGIEVKEGRSFTREFATDTASIIFNETAIKAMGLKNPIGKTVRHYSGDKRIIGIVKDFNMLSLHNQVEPAFFLLEPQKAHFIMARIQKGEELATLRSIEEIYQKFNPDYPFQAKFLDQDYQALYASESKIADLSSYFSMLAILISCLGLFGLAAYTTEKRQKEIGIRKVLGSGVWNIVYLLTRDFTKMVVIAIVIALPLSYVLGRRWLENYAYNISLDWSFFFLAGLGALLIAWSTVSFQTLKAALSNPVDSLKDE